MLIAEYSSDAHQRQTRFRSLTGARRGLAAASAFVRLLRRVCAQVLPYEIAVQAIARNLDPQRPREGPTSNRLVEALKADVQPRAPAGQSAPGIRPHLHACARRHPAGATLGLGDGEDHTQQSRSLVTEAAPYARAHRAHRRTRRRGRRGRAHIGLETLNLGARAQAALTVTERSATILPRPSGVRATRRLAPPSARGHA